MQVDSVIVRDTAPVTVDSADVRRATWTIERPAYAGSVAVELPPPPAAGHLDLRLGIAPIPVTIKVRCGEDASAGGVRRAYTTAQDYPSWAEIDLGQPVADDDVCSPASKGLQFRLNAPTIAVVGAAGLLGLLAGVLVF